MKRLRAGITWGVLSLFAATMVCGEGLHALVGFGHFSASAHYQHGCACGHSSLNPEEAGGRLALSASDEAPGQISESDCPICSFFAFAHCLPALPQLAGELTCVGENAAILRQLPLSDINLVYRSRAPPAAAC